MLGAGALGWPRRMVLGGRWEVGSGLGTCVHPWQMLVDVCQNQYNIVKYKNNKNNNKMYIYSRLLANKWARPLTLFYAYPWLYVAMEYFEYSSFKSVEYSELELGRPFTTTKSDPPPPKNVLDCSAHQWCTLRQWELCIAHICCHQLWQL